MPQLIEYRPHVVSPARPSFLDRLKAAYRSYTVAPISVKDPALAKLFGAGYQTSAGVTVNEHTAFTFSAVFDAVNQMSSDIAKLPLILKKRRQGGGSDDYTEAKLYRLLKDEPNPEMSSYTMRQTMMAHAMTCKGAFAEIERDPSRRPVGLWPITPERVEPKLKKRQVAPGRVRTDLVYQIDGDAQNQIPAADMIHIHGLGYDGYVGYDTINTARQAVGLALAAEKFGGSIFRHGRFGGLLTSEDLLDPTPEQKAELEKQIQQYKQGFEQFLILWGAKWKYDKTGIGSADAQLNEARDKQVEEVARFFNMPLHKLKVNKPGAVSYASVEMADLDYYKGPVLNWITAWEQELNRKLIAPLEYRQQFIKHNAMAFLRGDTTARTAFYTAMLDRGVYNADDVLDFEDLNPQPDGQGKIYLVQGAMVPKDKIVALADATIEAKNKPTPAPSAPAPNANPDDEPIRTLTVRLASLEIAIATAQAELERRLEGLATAAGAEQLAQLRADVAAAQVQIARFEAEAASLRSELDTARATEATALEQAQRERDLNTGLDATVRQLEQDLTAARLAELQTSMQFADLQAVLQAMEDRQAQARVDFLRQSIETWQTATSAQLVAQRDEFQAMRATHDQAVEALRQQLHEAETQRDAARSEITTATAAIRTSQAAANAARAESVQVRTMEAAGLSTQIQAHHELIVSIMRRMIERETDRGRQAKAHPDKFVRWIESFYEAHADLMRKSLLPAVRIHLAFVRSSDDPVETTRRLVEEHVRRSQLDLRQAVEGDADVASLTALFYRWDQERPTVLADRLMATELDYARRI